jgi:hypothetical protein
MAKKKRRPKPTFSRYRERLLFQASASKALIEAIYSTTRVDNFLLTREKGVAPTTHVNSDILCEC